MSERARFMSSPSGRAFSARRAARREISEALAEELAFHPEDHPCYWCGKPLNQAEAPIGHHQKCMEEEEKYNKPFEHVPDWDDDLRSLDEEAYLDPSWGEDSMDPGLAARIQYEASCYDTDEFRGSDYWNTYEPPVEPVEPPVEDKLESCRFCGQLMIPEHGCQNDDCTACKNTWGT